MFAARLPALTKRCFSTGHREARRWSPHASSVSDVVEPDRGKATFSRARDNFPLSETVGGGGCCDLEAAQPRSVPDITEQMCGTAGGLLPQLWQVLLQISDRHLHNLFLTLLAHGDPQQRTTCSLLQQVEKKVCRGYFEVAFINSQLCSLVAQRTLSVLGIEWRAQKVGGITLWRLAAAFSVSLDWLEPPLRRSVGSKDDSKTVGDCASKILDDCSRFWLIWIGVWVFLACRSGRWSRELSG
eukprot:3878227-Rhodomonas_salina.2